MIMMMMMSLKTVGYGKFHKPAPWTGYCCDVSYSVLLWII